jgi:hypothetical protein
MLTIISNLKQVCNIFCFSSNRHFEKLMNWFMHQFWELNLLNINIYISSSMALDDISKEILTESLPNVLYHKLREFVCIFIHLFQHLTKNHHLFWKRLLRKWLNIKYIRLNNNNRNLHVNLISFSPYSIIQVYIDKT